jgi:hypothetical protein
LWLTSYRFRLRAGALPSNGMPASWRRCGPNLASGTWTASSKFSSKNLQRRGFDARIIEREVIALDAAIRAALCRNILWMDQR